VDLNVQGNSLVQNIVHCIL